MWKPPVKGLEEKLAMQINKYINEIHLNKRFNTNVN